MKDRVKSYLFYFSIIYSVLVIFGMIINYTVSVNSIELKDSEENISKINNYKDQLKQLSRNECTYLIDKMIIYYEDTSYNGHVNLKEMYSQNLKINFLSFYNDIKKTCNINDEMIDRHNLRMEFLSSEIPTDEIFQRYFFQYEIGLKDVLTRQIIEPLIHNAEYQISKAAQVEIIGHLIEIERERGVQ
jgi:hypothetical protein